MIRLINRYLKTILKLIIAIGIGCVCLYIGYHQPRKSIQLYSLNNTQNSTLLDRDGPTSSAKPYWTITPTSTLANSKENRKTRENTNIFLEKNASLIQPINNQDANPKHTDRNSTGEKFGDKWTLAGKVWESADFKMKYTFNNIASDLMKDLLNFDYTGLNNFYPIHCDLIYKMTDSKRPIASSTNKKVYIVKYTGDTIRHINFFGDIFHNSRFVLKKLNVRGYSHRFMHRQRQKILGLKEILLYARLKSKDLAKLYGFCVKTKSGSFKSLETIRRLLYNLIMNPNSNDVIQIYTVSEYLRYDLEYFIEKKANKHSGPTLFFKMVDIYNGLLHSTLGIIKNQDPKLSNYRLNSSRGKLVVKIADYEALNTISGPCRYKNGCSIKPLCDIAPALLPDRPNYRNFIWNISQQYKDTMEIKYVLPQKDSTKMTWSVKPVNYT